MRPLALLVAAALLGAPVVAEAAPRVRAQRLGTQFVMQTAAPHLELSRPVALDLRVPHGPDDPTADDPLYDSATAIGPLFVIGAALILLAAGTAAGAATRNKAMREARSRQELDRVYRAQQALGVTTFVSLGAGATSIILNFVLP